MITATERQRASTFDIERFVGLLQAGNAAYVEAGRMLNAEVEANPESGIIDWLISELRISHEHLQRLMKLGRGEIVPEVFGIPCLSRLPLEEQRKAISGPVPVLCDNGDVLMVDLLQAAPALRKQVVAPNRIRTVEEQRQRKETLTLAAKRNARARIDQPWEVRGKALHVYAPTVISRATLQKLLEKMK